jgi:hypothetical protein
MIALTMVKGSNSFGLAEGCQWLASQQVEYLFVREIGACKGWTSRKRKGTDGLNFSKEGP